MPSGIYMYIDICICMYMCSSLATFSYNLYNIYSSHSIVTHSLQKPNPLDNVSPLFVTI